MHITAHNSDTQHSTKQFLNLSKMDVTICLNFSMLSICEFSLA